MTDEKKAKPTEPEKVALYLKILNVATAIEAIEKQGHNDKQHYDFTRAEDVYAAVRPLLHKEKLLLLPGRKSAEVRETQRVDRDSGAVTPGYPVTKVLLGMKWVDCETGYSEVFEWEGEGADPGDKSTNKAYTGALKTFLIAQFQIPTPGEDAEADTSTDDDTARGGKPSNGKPKFHGPARVDKRVSEGRVRRAFALKREHNFTNIEWGVLLHTFGITEPEELHYSRYDEFCDYIERKVPLPDPEAVSDVPADDAGLRADADRAHDDDASLPFA